mgnify:FL=1|tara:strand:- start:8096 stop:8818 length:723 start_codon:yes stop_codon:yes gene_type:complete
MLSDFKIFEGGLNELNNGKQLINTINAHSYNLTKDDALFKLSLLKSDVLLPDGIAVVWAVKFLLGSIIKKIAGADLFFYEMERLQNQNGKCFFLGSTEDVLSKIKSRASIEYPSIEIASYSPPYKVHFSEVDTLNMLEKVNDFEPDVLFIGMTAPKQEKWAHQNFDRLHVKSHICSVGAVFDFYAGSIERAPNWMISIGLEWLYRLLKEPKRMWRRYLIGNTVFMIQIIKEKLFKNNQLS